MTLEEVRRMEATGIGAISALTGLDPDPNPSPVPFSHWIIAGFVTTVAAGLFVHVLTFGPKPKT